MKHTITLSEKEICECLELEAQEHSRLTEDLGPVDVKLVVIPASSDGPHHSPRQITAEISWEEGPTVKD